MLLNRARSVFFLDTGALKAYLEFIFFLKQIEIRMAAAFSELEGWCISPFPA